MATNDQVIVDLAKHAFESDIKPAAFRHVRVLNTVAGEGGDMVAFMSLLAGHTMALAFASGVSLAKEGHRPIVLGVIKGLLLGELERQAQSALEYDGSTQSNAHAG